MGLAFWGWPFWGPAVWVSAFWASAVWASAAWGSAVRGWAVWGSATPFGIVDGPPAVKGSATREPSSGSPSRAQMRFSSDW